MSLWTSRRAAVVRSYDSALSSPFPTLTCTAEPTSSARSRGASATAPSNRRPTPGELFGRTSPIPLSVSTFRHDLRADVVAAGRVWLSSLAQNSDPIVGDPVPQPFFTEVDGYTAEEDLRLRIALAVTPVQSILAGTHPDEKWTLSSDSRANRGMCPPANAADLVLQPFEMDPHFGAFLELKGASARKFAAMHENAKASIAFPHFASVAPFPTKDDVFFWDNNKLLWRRPTDRLSFIVQITSLVGGRLLQKVSVDAPPQPVILTISNGTHYFLAVGDIVRVGQDSQDYLRLGISEQLYSIATSDFRAFLLGAALLNGPTNSLPPLPVPLSNLAASNVGLTQLPPLARTQLAQLRAANRPPSVSGGGGGTSGGGGGGGPGGGTGGGGGGPGSGTGGSGSPAAPVAQSGTSGTSTAAAASSAALGGAPPPARDGGATSVTSSNQQALHFFVKFVLDNSKRVKFVPSLQYTATTLPLPFSALLSHLDTNEIVLDQRLASSARHGIYTSSSLASLVFKVATSDSDSWEELAQEASMYCNLQGKGQVEEPVAVRCFGIFDAPHSGYRMLVLEKGEPLRSWEDVDRSAILSLMDRAHSLRLVHRDLAPRNLVRTAIGDLRLIDLGRSYFGEAYECEIERHELVDVLNGRKDEMDYDDL